jgi:hypothetical protein
VSAPAWALAVISVLAGLSGCARDRAADESKPTEARADAPTQYKVEDFYKNSEFFGASWAPDNQKVLVSSNLSGIWNENEIKGYTAVLAFLDRYLKGAGSAPPPGTHE